MIGFNIQGFVDKKQIKQIAEYLFSNFGFNSTLTIGLDEKEEFLFNKSKNKYQVSFRVHNEVYWVGLKIDFSGPNGHQFYKFIRANLVNWKIFSHEKDIIRSRLDLWYPHKKPNNQINFKSFFLGYPRKFSFSTVISTQGTRIKFLAPELNILVRKL